VTVPVSASVSVTVTVTVTVTVSVSLPVTASVLAEREKPAQRPASQEKPTAVIGLRAGLLP